MNGSYDPYPDFSPLYEPTSFSWWLFSYNAFLSNTIAVCYLGKEKTCCAKGALCNSLFSVVCVNIGF
jgi:ABC-type cobalt transport system substrate-binding protein